MGLKNKRLLVAASVSSVLLVVGAVLFASTAAHRGLEQHPAELQVRAENAAATPTTGASVKTDSFGNVQKKLGEEAGLIDEKTKKSYFTFEVATAQLLDTCPSRMGGPKLRPTRSHFLVLDVETELKEQIGEATGGSSDDLFMPLLADAFSVVDATGKIDRAVASDKAWECYQDSELAPSFVNPGEKAKGKIVLDVAATKGQVVYDPEGNGGWSWPFGG